jgi:hypothetical protein
LPRSVPTDKKHVRLDDVVIGKEHVERRNKSFVTGLPGVGFEPEEYVADRLLVPDDRGRSHDQIPVDDLPAQMVVREGGQIRIPVAAGAGVSKCHGAPPE